MVPILNLAEGQVGGDIPHHDVIKNLVDVLALHAVENHQGPAGEPNIHQRLLRAETEAADAGQMDIQAALVDGIGKGVKDRFRAIAGAAGPHPHGDARPERQQLGHSRPTNGAERAQIPDARHFFAVSLPKCSSSRCSVCSFMWP